MPKKEKKSTLKQKKKTIMILSMIGFVILAGLVLYCVLSIRSCSKANEIYQNNYTNLTKVGYGSEILGTVERKLPVEEKNEGFSTIGYPKYGVSFKECLGTSDEQKNLRNRIIEESSYLTSSDTKNAGGGGYNRMDAEGKLFLNDTPVLDASGKQRYLYKHTASVGLYLGDVSDEEPAVIKRLMLLPRGYNSYHVTGVYAPAGEVIKIELPVEDMEATGGITVHIGQALYNQKANNIWTDKNQMPRMPHLLNTMVVTKETAVLDEEKGVYTAYVGSYLGGPVYIQNEQVPFTVTLSGAVNYAHFILGYTTQEAYEASKNSTAPYFDLEVWEYGVLHSGPKCYAEDFSYDELYEAAVLWEKIALVSTKVRQQGIVFLYDPFVAAGAAVAFPSQYSVNCPLSWMSASLNYDAFVKNGAWGNMHEYNHHFQGWGVGEGGEVTNNALSLVAYSLFTQISSQRTFGTESEGLSGWNRYTSATWALKELTEERYSNGRYGLAIYADLLHQFGPDAFMKMVMSSGGQSVDAWFMASMNATGYDMTYYYKDLIGYPVSDTVLSQAAAKKAPMFVPVSCIYQTGKSVIVQGQKNWIETMQPYVIPYGKDFMIDLSPQSGSIILPNGFSYRIKNVTQPEQGELTRVGEEGSYLYQFTPHEENCSGKIYVTLEITKNDGAFQVADVDLVLEFESSHELKKNMLERTTYTYQPDQMYASAVEAFESGYANYQSKVEGDNQNPILNNRVVQDGNAEVWYTEASQMADHQIVEIKGKMFADEAGKYRIALRGRNDCALFVSLDHEESYQLAARYVQTNTSSANFPVDQQGNPLEGTYHDYELAAESWVYFKAVLITRNTNKFGFIGVGWGKFTPAEPVLDSTGNVVDITSETVKVSYANAYRSDYEFPTSKFKTDYFYTRDYSYNLVDNNHQTVVDAIHYSPWNAQNHVLENLVDGSTETFIHTKEQVSAQKPLILTVDMGKEIIANQMTMYTQYRPNNDYHCPMDFVLEGSLDGTEFFEIGDYHDVKRNGTAITVSFEDTQFRYYRLTITKSETSYIILSKIEFANWGHQLPLDREEVLLKGNWCHESMLSNFGHLYVSQKKASLVYEFEGTQFGLFISNAYTSSFEVFIDGEKMDSFDSIPITDRNLNCLIYPKLTTGKHQVIIKCKKSVGLDSIIYWD